MLITMPSHFNRHLLKLQTRKLKRMEFSSIPVECLRNTTMKSGSLPSYLCLDKSYKRVYETLQYLTVVWGPEEIK